MRRTMSDVLPIRRALLSVSDKTGLLEFGRFLAAKGVEILSTGGTAKALRDAGVPVKDVSDHTGFPEILDGRVKTLVPQVHGGILGRRDLAEHLAQMERHAIAPIDLVAVNLYPFEATVAKGADFDDCIENIDIGGPAMIRAAAKNHADVAVVVDAGDYAAVLADLDTHDGATTLTLRQKLAAKAYARTAAYDAAISNWFAATLKDDAPTYRAFGGRLAEALRYGENPHQSAAFYRTPNQRFGVATATQLQGKQLSYNNINDTDAAFELVGEFDPVRTAAVAIIKHANPCGVAEGGSLREAYEKALACDPVSAFGGVIATNREVTAAMAETVKDIFTEVVVAPAYEPAALEILSAKKNIRLLECDPPTRGGVETRSIAGGLLMQRRDTLDAVVPAMPDDKPTAGHGDDFASWTLVAGEAADAATARDLQFAWRAVRATKSNAILLARDGASVGVGMGQVNRVDSCKLAVARAGAERATGAVASSDAFFPFSDGPQILIDAGVRAIVTPGGSIRDDETIELCRARGVTLYFTGTRHFAH